MTAALNTVLRNLAFRQTLMEPAMPPYPTETYVAHVIFDGRAFPRPVWGDAMDGPGDWHDMLEGVRTHFRSTLSLSEEDFERITPRTLRVWHIEGGRAVNVTDEVIVALRDELDGVPE